jgi:cytochrome c-type biogenesis protein CcmH/NrfG
MYKVVALAVAIVALAGGGSFALTRYRISQDIEKGKGLAQERAAERDRQQSAVTRQKTMTDLLTTLEDSLQRRPLDSMLLISSANISYDLGQFEKATTYYKRFLENVDPSNTAIRIDYAYSLYQTGKQDEGKTVLTDVIRSEPRNQVAMLNLAVMYAQERNFDEALTWSKRCRDADPASELGKRAVLAITQLETNT